MSNITKTKYKGVELFSGRENVLRAVEMSNSKNERMFCMDNSTFSHKKFFHSNKFEHFLEKNHGLREIIPPNEPRKVYFDCDLKEDRLPEIKEQLKNTFPDAKLLISGCKSEEKVSYHIVIDNYYFKNHKEQETLKNWALINKGLFDPAVYGRNNQMKCVNQSKIIEKTNIEGSQFKKTRTFSNNIQKIIEGSDSPLDHLIVIKDETVIPKMTNALNVLYWCSPEKVINNGKLKKLSSEKRIKTNEEYDLINGGLSSNALSFLNFFPLDIDHGVKFKVLLYIKNCKLPYADFWNWKKTRGHNTEESFNKWKKTYETEFKENNIISRTSIVWLLKCYYPNIKMQFYEMLFLDDMNFELNVDIKRLYLEADDYIQPQKVIYNIVHMNGGKTESTIKFIGKFPSVLIVLSRESLVKSFMTRLNVKYPDKFICYDITLAENMKKYKTKKEKDDFIESINEDFYVTTINSLFKIKKEKYSCIVIDEYELLLNSFRPTTSGYKIPIESYIKLTQFLNTTNKLILLDAIPSQKGIRFLKNIGTIQNISDVCVIGSSVKHPYTQITKIVTKDGKTESALKCFLNKIIKDIKDEKQVYLFWPRKTSRCDDILAHKNQKEIALIIESKIGRKLKYMIYNSSSPMADKKTLSDVNTHWKDLDIVITGQSITVGVSYDASIFHNIYVADEGYVSEREIVQTSKRIRKITGKLYYVNISCKRYSDDILDSKQEPKSLYYLQKDVIDELRGRTELSIIKTYSKAGFKFDDYDCFSVPIELTGYEEIIDTSNNFMDIHLVDDDEIETADLSKISNKVNFCKAFSNRPSNYNSLFYDKNIASLWEQYTKVMAIYNIFPAKYKIIRFEGEYEEILEQKGIFHALKEYDEDKLNINEYPLPVKIFIKVLQDKLFDYRDSKKTTDDVCRKFPIYVATDDEYAFIKQVLYQTNPLAVNAGKEYSLILYLNTLMPFFFRKKNEDKLNRKERNIVYNIEFAYVSLLDFILDHVYKTKKEEFAFVEDL